MAGEIQVDAWGALVPGRGALYSQIKEGVRKKVFERQLPNLDISEGTLDMKRDIYDQWFRSGEPRDYLFFTQNHGKTAISWVALRVAKRGTMDLELSWRLFEGNSAKEIFKNGLAVMKTIFGLILAGAGLLTSIFGFGFIVIPIGVAIAISGINGLRQNQGDRNLTPEQQLDSRILAQTVDYCLMTQLEELGVSSDEVRVLQAAQMEGIGRLGNPN